MELYTEWAHSVRTLLSQQKIRWSQPPPSIRQLLSLIEPSHLIFLPIVRDDPCRLFYLIPSPCGNSLFRLKSYQCCTSADWGKKNDVGRAFVIYVLHDNFCYIVFIWNDALESLLLHHTFSMFIVEYNKMKMKCSLKSLISPIKRTCI